MVDALYTRAAATALRLLTKYGQPVTLVRQTSGPYDPTTGTSPVTTTTYAGYAAVFAYPAAEVDGTMIQRGDKRAYLTLTGATPLPSDAFTIAGVTHAIVNVEALDPGGLVVMYTLQVRVGG